MSKALTQAFPALTFVVEDQAEVIANATVEDEGSKGRIAFLEHDFFTPQPVLDADIFFVRRVLIEWPDWRGRRGGSGART
ncbi:MAG: hypothetical protein INR71_04815 [Terriglobus roseus]|nr:hypothetical protein [Terriglobus roseus]